MEKKYTVILEQREQYLFEVEAENVGEAIDKASQRFSDGETGISGDLEVVTISAIEQ